jgi:hypothetical protein
MRDEVIKKSKELRYCKSCPKRTLKREDKNGLVIQVVLMGCSNQCGLAYNRETSHKSHVINLMS